MLMAIAYGRPAPPSRSALSDGLKVLSSLEASAVSGWSRGRSQCCSAAPILVGVPRPILTRKNAVTAPRPPYLSITRAVRHRLYTASGRAHRVEVEP